MTNPSRRTFLRSATAGSILFPGIVNPLLADEGDPMAVRQPHLPAKAKNVIFLFMTGGVSHIDTFDPKPELTKQHGKEIPSDHPSTKDRPDYQRIYLKRPDWEFTPYGESGTEVSSLFPHVGELYRRHRADSFHVHLAREPLQRRAGNAYWFLHDPAAEHRFVGDLRPRNTQPQSARFRRHCACPDLCRHAGLLQRHSSGRASGNAGRARRGTSRNVKPRVPVDRQQLELAALQEFNSDHLATRGGDPNCWPACKLLRRRFGMQMAVPDVFDFADETQDTLSSYGLEPGQTSGFGWQCLAARRLVERGVRFVELIDTGSSGNWDSHGDMSRHEPLAKNVDRPIAALLRDLKQRGMLNETLVVWTTEFGRTPFNKTADHKGREHHPLGFSSWMAGGGVKPGIVHGATDEIGMNAAEKPVHVRDFHATILHLMGLDHERLSMRHAGLDVRLTGVEHAQVVKEILA